jgi:hypothetical protein
MAPVRLADTDKPIIALAALWIAAALDADTESPIARVAVLSIPASFDALTAIPIWFEAVLMAPINRDAILYLRSHTRAFLFVFLFSGTD